MLAGAPLMVAQLGAFEFRKKMLEGNNSVLSNLKLGTSCTVAEMLKLLGQASPLSILRLCNKDVYNFLLDSLLQHSDDLNFVQEVLSATANYQELNPILNAVQSAFGRRRKYNRFKYGNQCLDLDRLRFSHTKSEKDHDLLAKDVTGASKKGKSSGSESTNLSLSYCRFFQREGGCRFSYGQCRFAHKCILCNSQEHGATSCSNRKRTRKSVETGGSSQQRKKSQPPDPRFRRDRAN